MSKFELFQGDITACDVDVIVNAANVSLLGGGGVDGAIHSKAGPELLEECRTLGGCQTGGAKITNGYRLTAKHVIHTVGPIWRGGRGQESELLGSCYQRCLELASEFDIKSIAFPCISTGIYHFPKEDAAEIAVTTVNKFIKEQAGIEKVIFVCFNKEDFEIYLNLLKPMET